MPCALPLAVRQQIIELKSKGSSLQSIANEQHLSYATLSRLWKRYKAEGTNGLTPHYNACGPAAGISRCAPVIYRAVVWLKRCHPDWGAALIRLCVQDRYKDMVVPAERTLQQWFRAKKLYKLKSRFPAVQSIAQQAHDVWQIDAKEKLCLLCGQQASYLSVVDQYSGALLKAAVFPPLPHQ
jgi:helix-turn-helix protein